MRKRQGYVIREDGGWEQRFTFWRIENVWQHSSEMQNSGSYVGEQQEDQPISARSSYPNLSLHLPTRISHSRSSTSFSEPCGIVSLPFPLPFSSFQASRDGRPGWLKKGGYSPRCSRSGSVRAEE